MLMNTRGRSLLQCIRTVSLGTLLGLAASSSLSASSRQDFQVQIEAARRAAQSAAQEEEQADSREAGLILPDEQFTPDGIRVVLTTGHAQGVAAVGISADGRYVVSGDAMQVKVWDVASHSEVRTIPVTRFPGAQSNFRVTSGGCRLLLGQQTRLEVATLADCVTGKEIASASLISDDGSVSVSDASALSRLNQAGAGTRGAGLTITDLATEIQSVLPAPAGSVSLAISANGQTVLTNHYDVDSSGWRSTLSDVIGIVGGIASAVVPVGAVAGLITNTATDTVGSSPTEETVDIEAWNVRTRHKLLTVRSSPLANLVALSFDGRWLFIDNKDRSIDAYDLVGGAKRRLAQADTALTSAEFVHDRLVVSADGSELARQARDGSVEILDTLSGRKLAAFAADAAAAASSLPASLSGQSAIAPVFSPDGKLIAVGSVSQRIQVWEIATGHAVFQTEAAAIAFSADGRTAIVGRSSEGAPILHDLATGREEGFGVHLDSVAQVAVTADGRLAIATNAQGGARLWDLATGQLAGNLTSCPGGSVLLSARPSPTAGLVAAKCGDGSVALWDQASAQWKERLSAPTPDSPSVRELPVGMSAGAHRFAVGEDVHFSADGRLLAIASDEQVTVWNLEAHRLIAHISTHDLPIPPEAEQLAAIREAALATATVPTDPELLRSMSQSQRELLRAVAAEQRSGAAQLRQQLADPVFQEEMSAAERQILAVAIEDNGHQLALLRGGEVSLWDYLSGKILRTLPAPAAKQPGRLTGGLQFGPDGLMLYGPDGVRWDLSSGEAVVTPMTSVGPAVTARLSAARKSAGMSRCCDTTLALSPDGKLLARGVGMVVRLTDVASGQDLGDLVGHTRQVASLVFAPDGKTLLSGSEDGSLRVWNIGERKEAVSLYALGAMDYVAVSPDQFYRASKARLSGISFRVNDRLYPFEQFDLRFNRPDLIAEALGHASPDLLQDYRKARARRLKKMGFTEAMLAGDFHLPEVHIVGTELPARIAADSLSIRVRAQDSQYALDRINVFVNDVPVLGTAGMPVVDRQSQSVEQPVAIPLVPGVNKIQVSALNQQGVESYKQTFYTMNTLASTPGDIYVVAIGVSKYLNPRYNLRFAAKDASDLMNLYGAEGASAHGQVHLLSLTDEHANRAEIRRAREWLAQARPKDLAIVFAAGHGLTDARNDYYFGTYDIDAAHPEINGLPYEEFETLLDGIPPLKKLLLLDTCFSGEIDKEDSSVVADAATDGNGTVKMRSFRAMRGIGLVPDAAGAASGTSGTHHFEDLFADLRRGTGAVVISSASGNEYALEGERWNNGVFTYAVLSGLKERRADANKDGVVTVGELQAYVIEEVRKLTAGGQNPTVRQENLDFDFRIY